ncbi:MAG: DUF1566 domain-containing protein [Candidatus Nealsonbacteria bacterium]|nr:DUF1566 domain-containing protein [Candidatus Nealsonbacteria bacterium]
MKYKNLKSYKILVVFAIIIVVGVISFLVVRANPDSISDSFTNETKIGKGTEKVEIATTTGQVKLAECYSPNPSWNWSTTTIVRDISNLSNALATTTKKIFCDDYNCILLPNAAATPTAAVCIATDSNVYANLLWSKTDVSGTKTWGPATPISGGDIGGTHDSSLKIGKDNTAIGAQHWLERYYTSAAGTFLAMDACKAKGSAWRLPTILELDSIRDQAKGSSPYSRLPGISTNYYWSSSEFGAGYVCVLQFGTGSVFNAAETNSYSVRCVRGQ